MLAFFIVHAVNLKLLRARRIRGASSRTGVQRYQSSRESESARREILDRGFDLVFAWVRSDEVCCHQSSFIDDDVCHLCR
jgi:hypothetical protein